MDRARIVSVVAAAALMTIVVWVLRPRDGDGGHAVAPGPGMLEAGPADAASDAAGTSSDDATTSATPGGIEVKMLDFGDGSVDQRSVRVLHPNVRVQARLHDWLEPRETNATATGSALECVADTATRKLVSVRCVSVAPSSGGLAPEPSYASLTLQIQGDDIRELAIADVLRTGVSGKEVIDACKRAADPPLPCQWPPTAFSIVQGTSLFICHGSRCVDLPEEEHLVRGEDAADAALARDE